MRFSSTKQPRLKKSRSSTPLSLHQRKQHISTLASQFTKYSHTQIHHSPISSSSLPFSSTTSTETSTVPQPHLDAAPKSQIKFNLFRGQKLPLESRSIPSSKRVVITGMGVVSPLGNDVEEMFSKMLHGVTAIQEIKDEHFTKLNLQAKSYAPVGPLQIDDENIVPRNLRQILSRHQVYAILAAHNALKQANLLGHYTSKPPPPQDSPNTDANEQIEGLDERKQARSDDDDDASKGNSGSEIKRTLCASGHEELCGVCEGEPECVYIRDESDRFGVCIGNSIGDVEEIGAAHTKIQEKGGKGAGAYSLPKLLVNLAAGHITQLHNARALTHTVSTACATGAHAIGDAFNFIRSNKADVIIAGGTESGVSQLSLALFNRIHALSRQAPDTSGAPFTEQRDGFVMGEGAAMVIVESLESAQKRGANIICEVLGYGISSDAYHMTQPHRLGRGAYMAMENALNDAGINMNHVDYVNAHATSTPIGDIAESQAIRALSQHHYQKYVEDKDKKKTGDETDQNQDHNQNPNGAPAVTAGKVKSVKKNIENRLFARPFVSSTKGHVGHLLGAAGAFEAVVSIMAIDKNKTPPTLLRHGTVSPNLPVNVISFQSSFVGKKGDSSLGLDESTPKPTIVSRWEELYSQYNDDAVENRKPMKDLEDGVDYYLTERGYVCFTEKFHLDKGCCCENACKHCPYGFNPEKRELQKGLGLEKGELDLNQSIDVTLSNSFGFGGANASLVFGRFIQ